MKERGGFLLMAIGLVLILIGFSMWEYVAYHEPTTAIMEQNDEMNEWKTYSDNEYHFSIQYPSDFTMTEEPGESVTLVVPVENYFRTKLAGEAKLTIVNPAATCAPMNGEEYAPTSSVAISSSAGEFKKVSWNDAGAGQIYEVSHYTLNKNGLCYSLQLLLHSTNGAGFYYSDPEEIAMVDAEHAKDKAAFTDLIDKIVSTFSIIK